MKTLFFIVLITIGLATNVQAQCVADHNFDDSTLCGLDENISFNGTYHRCIIIANTSTPKVSVYVSGVEYSANLNYLYPMAGAGLYHVQFDANGIPFEFVAIIDNSKALKEYDICKN